MLANVRIRNLNQARGRSRLYCDVSECNSASATLKPNLKKSVGAQNPFHKVWFLIWHGKLEYFKRLREKLRSFAWRICFTSGFYKIFNAGYCNPSHAWRTCINFCEFWFLRSMYCNANFSYMLIHHDAPGGWCPNQLRPAGVPLIRKLSVFETKYLVQCCVSSSTNCYWLCGQNILPTIADIAMVRERDCRCKSWVFAAFSPFSFLLRRMNKITS